MAFPRMLVQFVSGVLILATIAYPFAVYALLESDAHRWLAFLIAAVAGLRAIVRRETFWGWCAAGALLIGTGGLFRQDALLLKLYPVLVNGVLLCAFAYSLWKPPSVVERLARLTHPDLPAAGVRYTEQVTRVWCGFFVLNATAAAYTALYASEQAWVLYNGLLAYLLMGALMLGERLWRMHAMKHHGKETAV